VAKPELGGKRQCQKCSTKFFDLNKSPIVCPKCSTVFHLAQLARSTGRTAPVGDDEIEIDPAAAELVALEDADGPDAKVVDLVEDDIEIGDDDPFLEEDEEDNDDVVSLIDGDIENEEEA
jgi:uncharacterized protein (TIGR02300 family)